MEAKLSLVGYLARVSPFRSDRLRRRAFVAAIAACALFTFYPQQYRAALSLTPADPSSLGLGGAVGQLGALNSVFGNQSAVEVSMKVAASPYVKKEVVAKLGLDKRLNKSPISAQRWIEREIEIRSMRGGIIQFEMKLGDPKLAIDVVTAYGEAVRSQLGTIARNQTAYKRQILVDLVDQASERLAKAQTAYDTFRLQTRYSQPQAAISAIGDRIPQLEAEIKSKEVVLNAQQQFATDGNMRVRQTVAELQALRMQLAEAKSVSPSEQNSVGRVVRQSTQADKLRRELDLAQGLYDNYKRFLQGTSVEDLTSTANVRVLEPAYIDPDRQYNFIPLVLGILLVVLSLALEFYLILPGVGEGRLSRIRKDSHDA